MSLAATRVPFSASVLPYDRSTNLAMSYQQQEDRQYATGYYRPPGSSHGAPPPGAEAPSPERLHSAGGVYSKSAHPPQSPVYQQPSHDVGPAPGSSHGYPPQPITPISGPNYPSQLPPPQGFYGITGQDPSIPSPPPTSSSRPASSNFTNDGTPIVPVGISGGKMFKCRGFPGCEKVFTRSEHLARHVRKHTGERPFPCHCGKAFSRLDNLRQHAATVHADHAALNDAMLNSLASVHAALSQRANREQRRRGEVVEVPKNAVERPRTERNKSSAGKGPVFTTAAYPPPQAGWSQPAPDDSRPRTAGGGWAEYPAYPHPPPAASSVGYIDDAGPSRRPPSSGYPQNYYDQHRPSVAPPSAPLTATSDDSSSQLPYPYRPMSSNGRDIPVPAHYADSEPPSSAHGPPPHSPMYPPAGVQAPNWTSPPPAHAASYSEPMYPSVQTEGAYHSESQNAYGPAPPSSSGSSYYYPPPPPTAPYVQQSPGYVSVPPPVQQSQYPPPEPPFQYNASPDGPYGYYDGRKRRVEEEGPSGSRKMPRASDESGQPRNEPPAPQQDALWLPPTTERRSSLAISALLGSPQQEVRSRPSTASGVPPAAPATAYYPFAATDDGRSHAPQAPPTLASVPSVNGRDEKPGILVDRA